MESSRSRRIRSSVSSTIDGAIGWPVRSTGTPSSALKKRPEDGIGRSNRSVGRGNSGTKHVAYEFIKRQTSGLGLCKEGALNVLRKVQSDGHKGIF